eukprot:9900574-Ditylum_brightwellii.AAC.1
MTQLTCLLELCLAYQSFAHFYLGLEKVKKEDTATIEEFPRIGQGDIYDTPKWDKETFTQQTCQRIVERAVLDHFGHLMKESEEKKEAESSPREKGDVASPSDKRAVDSFLQKQPNFKIYREGGDATIEVYNELCLCNSQTVQATLNYKQAGPWYDVVNIVWEVTESDSPNVYVPTMVLAFVNMDGNNTEVDEGKYALIHLVEKKVLVKNKTLLTT